MHKPALETIAFTWTSGARCKVVGISWKQGAEEGDSEENGKAN